jgi:hypothetical protein
MKIVKFFLIIWGKLSELEFFTSWSRSWSRTKMDRLRNTAKGSIIRPDIRHIPTENFGTIRFLHCHFFLS